MTLGDIIKKYREEHNMSMNDFAQKSKLSKGYISMLENNKNPGNKKAIAPSLETFSNVAKAVGMSFEQLLAEIDGSQPVLLRKIDIDHELPNDEIDRYTKLILERPDIKELVDSVREEPAEYVAKTIKIAKMLKED